MSSSLTSFSNNQVKMIFRLYPENVRAMMLDLRELVFETAKRLAVDAEVGETLKWGEPSYLCPKGSTIRMDWKEKAPDVCQLYFSCQTSLVSTFREIYPELDFEGNRAIRLPIDLDFDRERIAHCMELSLRYHSVKSLPLLGAESRH